jgi:uncharacterized protein (TIGR02246 family)
MDDLSRLVIEQACRDLVMRSVACVDAHDATGFAALFLIDGVLRRPGGAPLNGRAAIEHAYAQRPRERMTRHLVANTRVVVASAVAARGTSQVLLWAGSVDDAVGAQGRPARGPQILGEFEDWFEFVSGEGWLIARREARFVLHSAA